MYLAIALLILLLFGSSSAPLYSSNAITGSHPSFRESQQANARGMPLVPATRSEVVDNQEGSRSLAAIAFAEGKQLELQGTAESLRKALEKYEKALGLWRSLHDRPGEATALGGIGTVRYLLGDWQMALEVFQQQLEILRAIGDRPKEAEALNNIGVVYGALGQHKQAIDSYLQALPLRRAVNDRHGVANTLDNLGLFYLNTGELQKALDYCSQALDLYRELNASPGIANALNNVGGVLMTLGDYRKALDYFRQALELRKSLGHRREEAMALNNIGQVHYLRGESQQALDFHRQALELRRTLGLRAHEAVSINNIGFVYDWLGEEELALDHYKQALDLFRAAKERHGEASALNNIGAHYLNTLKNPKTALEYYLQALEMRRAMGQRIDEAIMLDNIGHLYKSQGELRKALEYHRQALEIRRAAGHRLGEAASLNNFGSVYFEMGELQQALDFFNQALLLHRNLGTRSFEALTLYGLARIERQRGNLAAALLHMENSLNIIESLRGGVASQDLRSSFLAQKQDYYEFYTDLLIQLHQREPSKGHDISALRASERARARSMLELLAEARIDVEQGVAPELKQRERLINKRITWIQSRLIDVYAQAQPDQSKAKTLEEELKQVDEEREQLNSEIRKRHPRYADLQYPAPLELKAIQALLDDQTILLEYALGKDASFLFAVTKNSFAVARLSSDASIASQVKALRATITTRPQRSMVQKQLEHSRKLYRELIEPARKLLPGKRKLIIVPSGILHYLPFEVLLSSGEARTLATVGPDRWPYLLKDFAVSYVPSAGVLASLRGRSESPSARKTFLAFADPAYVNDKPTGEPHRGAFGDQQSWKLGRLPESRREVEQISRLYGKDRVSLLLGDDASEENVKTAGRFRDYRYVHFATHGLLNEDRPPYSGLILSLSSRANVSASTSPKPVQTGQQSHGVPQPEIRNPQSEDGLLQVYEIFNLKLNADLVVLSACETGLGKQVKGEGLVGLTHAFFYAGTPSIMVSLWKVQDRSTADLMFSFYQHLDSTKEKTEALRLAKLELIGQNRYAHPYYWAPFVLVGEPK